MACAISTGYTLPCRDNQGGIKAVYVGSFNDTAMTFTIGTGASASYITSIGGATVSFYTVAQRMEQGSANYKNTNSIDNGTNYTEQTVAVTIEQVDNVLTNWINILNQGIWRIIVLDNVGRYWLYGMKNGMYSSGSDGGPSKAIGDGNKTTITFVGKEPYLPYQIATAAATSVIM